MAPSSACEAKRSEFANSGGSRQTELHVTDKKFDEILASNAAMLGRIAASYEAQPAAREDLLQEIALALWRALPQWRGEASVRSFVARVAHNRCVSHIVAQRRHRHDCVEEDALVDQQADPHRDAVSHQRYERLQRALRRLPLGQRQAVTLALEGFSHLEIAEALDIKPNTVDARISRARRTLANYLEEQA
jgi:RNA polymerase sigma-70 factor (ECF subfamily)